MISLLHLRSDKEILLMLLSSVYDIYQYHQILPKKKSPMCFAVHTKKTPLITHVFYLFSKYLRQNTSSNVFTNCYHITYSPKKVEEEQAVVKQETQFNSNIHAKSNLHASKATSDFSAVFQVIDGNFINVIKCKILTYIIKSYQRKFPKVFCIV